MRRLLRFGVLAALLGASTSACVVREQPVVVARPAPCAGGYWVQGHYDRVGRWHPSHWRCPGVIEYY